MRKQTLYSLITLIYLLALFLPGTQPPTATAQNGTAAEVIRLVNELRASLGLYPFTINGQLVAAAQGHAEWMAANVSYTHTGANGSRPQDRAYAAGYNGVVVENIVGGTLMTVSGGVEWWRNSSIHYRTMTSTQHTQVGAGYAYANNSYMYVLVVGMPSGGQIPAANSGSTENTNTTTSNNDTTSAALPAVVIPVEVAEPREDGSIVHVIQSGQTAWDVAAVYEMDLVELLDLNNLSDNPILLPGDEITIKLADNPTTPTEPLRHTIRLGDTAWSIAATYDVDLGELMAINGWGENPLLQPGEEIIVRLPPGEKPPPTATPPTSHTVQTGETAWSIAAAYGLTLDQLLALNNLSADPVLMPGDQLEIRGPDPTATLAPSQTPAPSPTLPPAPTGTPAHSTAPGQSTVSAEPSTPTQTASQNSIAQQPAATLRAATMTPTVVMDESANDAGSARSLTDTLITVGLVLGIGLAVLAVLAAVIGNILERRRD